MYTHSRRTFIRLGALAAVGPLVGKLVPAYLQAAERVSSERLVLLRTRVVPVDLGVTVMGHYSRSVALAWSQTQIPMLSRAQVAGHDTLRPLMEGLGISDPIAHRARPLSSLRWFVQLCYSSWDLNGVQTETLIDAERQLFEGIDANAALCADGLAYNEAARQGANQLAASLNTSVDLRFPCVVRLDRPHRWLWTSSGVELSEPATGVGIISEHLRQNFVVTLEQLVQRPEQWRLTRAHLKPAFRKLQDLRA